MNGSLWTHNSCAFNVWLIFHQLLLHYTCAMRNEKTTLHTVLNCTATTWIYERFAIYGEGEMIYEGIRGCMYCSLQTQSITARPSIIIEASTFNLNKKNWYDSVNKKLTKLALKLRVFNWSNYTRDTAQDTSPFCIFFACIVNEIWWHLEFLDKFIAGMSLSKSWRRY